MKNIVTAIIFMALPYHLGSQVIQSGDNPNSPSMPVRLLFIHHSTGTNWLNDENGRLGIAFIIACLKPGMKEVI
jgi:hypothetical protein